MRRAKGIGRRILGCDTGDSCVHPAGGRQCGKYSKFRGTNIFLYRANGKSIKGVAGNAESLKGSADESAAAIQEIVASIQQVAGNAESTASSVEQISSSIEQMGRSIEGVAGNAESLKASADEASAAIQEIVASIQQVAGNAEVQPNLLKKYLLR